MSRIAVQSRPPFFGNLLNDQPDCMPDPGNLKELFWAAGTMGFVPQRNPGPSFAASSCTVPCGSAAPPPR